jgi:gentisate 1,2-dioxygenase
MIPHLANTETPRRPVDESPLRFPWSEMKARLDARKTDYAFERYYDNTTGGQISRTLGAAACRVAAGTTASPKRTTCSFIFHVVAGSGRSDISGINSATLEWKKGDTFAVPAWSHVKHIADKGEDVYLFVLSDEPMLERLDMVIVDEK